MEFLGVILVNAEKNREEKFSNVARDAYTEVLEFRHPFLVRKVVKASVVAAASREKFIASIKAE